jgi:predicted dehydrogenase
MAAINWGIIGCGDVTEVKSGPAFNKVPGSNLVAVMRRNAEKAADYAKRHHVGKWYANAAELMNDKEVNSIYIATPPSSHLEYAISALKKGFNVYVEKPVTLNADEAQQIADTVKQTNGRLTVAHYRRAQPMFLFIKDLLDKDVIGEIRTVQIRMWKTEKPDLVAHVADNWRVNPELSGGGYFHDLAPHQLDLMLFYFGEPVYYDGYSLNQSGTTAAADHVAGHIIFKNKVAVNGSWCFNVAKSEAIDECKIIGTKGSISFPFFGYTVNFKTEDEDKTINFPPLEHVQQPLIEKIVDYFNDKGPNPSSIEEAVVLMKIMDAFSRHR